VWTIQLLEVNLLNCLMNIIFSLLLIAVSDLPKIKWTDSINLMQIFCIHTSSYGLLLLRNPGGGVMCV
jgi:hypothetical protein